MCRTTHKKVWVIFFAMFLAVTIASISSYYTKEECTNLGPTISASLFQPYYQGIAIIFFTLGAFIFSKDREKLLKLSLAIFAIAFIVADEHDNGVHIVAVIVGTGGLWIAVAHKLYEHDLEKTGKCCWWLSVVFLMASIATGVAFFYYDINEWPSRIFVFDVQTNNGQTCADIQEGYKPIMDYYECKNTVPFVINKPASLTINNNWRDADRVRGCHVDTNNMHVLMNNNKTATEASNEISHIICKKKIGGGPCYWAGILEYIAFSMLFASTYILVPQNKTFYLFEDPKNSIWPERQPRSTENMRTSRLEVAAFFPAHIQRHNED